MSGSCRTLNASPSPLKSISTAVVSVHRVHHLRGSSLTQAHDRQSCSGAICTVVEPAHRERDCEGKMRRWSVAAFISTEVLHLGGRFGSCRARTALSSMPRPPAVTSIYFVDGLFPHPPTHQVPLDSLLHHTLQAEYPRGRTSEQRHHRGSRGISAKMATSSNTTYYELYRGSSYARCLRRHARTCY